MSLLMMVVSLMLAAVVVVAIGNKVGLPWPVLLTVLAAGAIFLPDLPSIHIPAELILPIFLPPLLWAMARRTSWGVIKTQWFSIVMLSVLLVLVSTAIGAATAMWLMPGMTLAGAVVLSSALAPTDAVAVEAVAEPAGIPRRLSNTLQNEGLFNDAASIVCFSIALGAVESGGTIDLREGVLDFLYNASVAIIMGLVMGFVAAKIFDWIDSPVARNAFSWVLPFAVYLVTDEVGASGVIAVIIAGVEMHSRVKVGAEDRLTGHAFWEPIEMLFTAAAFGLVGLSVRDAVKSVGATIWHGVWVGFLLSLVLVVVRFIWLMIMYRLYSRKKKKNVAPLRLQEVLLLTWSGMRGLVTLALVLAIPAGGYIPWQHELSVIAITVMAFTMVFPGLTLPWLVRQLSLDRGPDAQGDIARERLFRRARDAANVVIQANMDALPHSSISALQNWIMEETNMDEEELKAKAKDVRHKAAEVRFEALAAAQRELLSARREPGVDPAIVDEVLTEIDRMIVAARRN
ncbi:MAG: sodium:proton antiporter [Corynebacterium sp.]|nr:sodium:proton antiporter [Corynebacterium sp.]